MTGGGSGIIGVGGEGSVGFYASGYPTFDIGVMVSGGAGGGGNIGLSAQVGYVRGTLPDVSGTTINYNASAAIGSGTVMTDPNTGAVAGFSIGPAGRLGFSKTISKTSTYGLSDIASYLMDHGLGKAIDKVCGR